jgi:hypothetical protein
MVFSPLRCVLRPCNCHESAGVPFYGTDFHVAIRGVNSFQGRYAWKNTEVPMWFSIVASTAWRCTFENHGRQKGRLLRPHSEMMAITQRNLVFAHIYSMRPIENLEARLGTPKEADLGVPGATAKRLAASGCDSSRQIVVELSSPGID